MNWTLSTFTTFLFYGSIPKLFSIFHTHTPFLCIISIISIMPTVWKILTIYYISLKLHCHSRVWSKQQTRLKSARRETKPPTHISSTGLLPCPISLMRNSDCPYIGTEKSRGVQNFFKDYIKIPKGWSVQKFSFNLMVFNIQIRCIV